MSAVSCLSVRDKIEIYRRAIITNRRHGRDNTYIDICIFDRSGEYEATRRTRNARRNILYMRVRVIVRHVSPSVDLNFKSTSKKRSESVDVNRYASISHRT